MRNVPCGFLLHFDTKVLRYESIFIKKKIIIKFTNLLRMFICHLWYRSEVESNELHLLALL